MFKKGTDKPIEIFIALFIILAVAMVILKMFSGQIQDKTKELAKIEQKEQFQQAKGDAKRECDEICTSALQNDCSPQYKAQFCQHMLINGLDIDMNGNTKDYSEDLLGGIGVCEDSIYCPQVTTCTCNDELNMINCIDIVYEYYQNEMGQSGEKSCELLGKKILPGKCVIPADAVFWHDTIANNIINLPVYSDETPATYTDAEGIICADYITI